MGCTWMGVGTPALPEVLEEPLLYIVRDTHCLEAASILFLPRHAPRSFLL